MLTIALALMLTQPAEAPAISICPCKPCKCGMWRLCDEAPEIQWRSDYAAALIESKETGKPLFVYFTGAECIWCRKLEAATFRNKDVRKSLAGFVSLKLDGAKHANLAKLLWVRRYPTLILAAPDGTILTFDEGFVEPITFKLRLKRALADTKGLQESK